MENNFQVNLEGIISLLSEHIYSTPDVFIREVLQNSVDAITAGKRLKEIDETITIELFDGDNDSKILSIEDKGIGLSKEDILNFLSIIGESSKNKKIDAFKDDFIGRFGIGLLSCFIVSDKISIITRKIYEDKCYKWVGYGNGTYELSEIDSDIKEGTTLYLRSNEDTYLYFERDNLLNTLKFYGEFLPYKIVFKHNDFETVINDNKDFFDAYIDKQKAKEVCEDIFDEDFIDVLPIRSNLVNGYLCLASYPMSINVKATGRVYSKGMFVTTTTEKIIPNWGFFLKPLLNCNNIRLTASREDFYVDEELLAIREIISEAIKNYIKNIAEYDIKKLDHILFTHYLSLKQIITQNNDLYPLIIPHIEFETNLGNMTLNEIEKRFGEIIYMDNMNDFKQVESISRSQNMCVINASYIFDVPLIHLYQQVSPNLKIFSGSPEQFVNIFDDIEISDYETTTTFLKIAKDLFADKEIEVKIKKYEPIETSVIYLANQNLSEYNTFEEIKDNDNLFSNIANQIFAEKDKPVSILCFNIENQLIKYLLKCNDKKIVESVINILYVQSLTNGGYFLSKKDLNMFSNNLSYIIEKAIK